MNAWLWTASPNLWRAGLGMTGFEALRMYLEDESGIVYWATPKFRENIRAGDTAYIWRTKRSPRDDQNGIVAVGEVTETPHEFNGDNGHEFGNPEQLESAGWDEGRATSEWKTGIRIERLFWNTPVNVPGLMVRETINLLNVEQHQRIDAMLLERLGGP
jgi:hypothetical protein